jgi:2-polyprenyl-6-methoxyphenol hydroxylase-like FAD-dependent oxidoreductase
VTARHDVDVCIAGAGPAGLTLALLLAQEGIRTLVLEHNEDFAREYRGEVLMPRFMQAFEQVGLDSVLAGRPQHRLTGLFMNYRDRPIATIDLSKVSREHPYALWIPQPSLLEALHDRGRTMPAYDLWFHASARDLVREDGRVAGVVVKRGADHVTVKARLVVAADGRYSRLRKEAGIDLEIDQHDFDVIWFDLPRPPGNEATFRVYISPRRNFLLLPKHPDLFQCGMFGEPGALAHYRARGIESLREDLLAGPSLIHAFARGLKDFSPFVPLDARIGLARTWAQDGFLLVGDAAHTCSPAGAVGVAVAVETAIVAAEVIRKGIRSGPLTRDVLAAVQRIRGPEVRRILALQRRFAGVFAATTGWTRRLRLLVAPILARLGLLPIFFRRLAVRSGPLPVPPDLRLR